MRTSRDWQVVDKLFIVEAGKSLPVATEIRPYSRGVAELLVQE